MNREMGVTGEGSKFEVFSELRTTNFKPRIAPFSHILRE